VPAFVIDSNPNVPDGRGASAFSARRIIELLKPSPFVLAHVGAILGAIYVGASVELVLLALALYAVRMFFITAGYHRYFAQGSFKTSRAFQFVLALSGDDGLTLALGAVLELE
jgi:stearoyl-CoA desaturase (Delta-9 desaturase)